MQSNQRPRHTNQQPAERMASRRAWCVIGPCLLAIVIFLAVMLPGCGPKSYTDPDYGFSFEFSGDWTLGAVLPSDLEGGVTESVGAFDPEGVMSEDGYDFVSVRVYDITPGAPEVTAESLQTEFESWLTDAQGFYSGMQIVEPITAAKVGGLDGYKATFTFTDQGVALRTTEYVLLSDTVMYDLFLQSAEETWAANQEIFAGFLSSFKPGAGR
jgi:hypothetical protein